MKSEIFFNAIQKRNKIRFYYGINETIIDPYFITIEHNGKKVIYGKIQRTNEIKKFEFKKIANIKIITNSNFTPIIPIIPYIN